MQYVDMKKALGDQPPVAIAGKQLEIPAQISENGLEVLRRRYLRKGLDGKPMETVPEMFWRVASNVALPERVHEGDAVYQATAEEFYDLLTTLRFFPNSPTFTGAGRPSAAGSVLCTRHRRRHGQGFAGRYLQHFAQRRADPANWRR